jgi:hypothetical protein
LTTPVCLFACAGGSVSRWRDTVEDRGGVEIADLLRVANAPAIIGAMDMLVLME